MTDPQVTIPVRVVPDANDPDTAELLVEGEVDGRPYTFLFDTGAAGTSMVSDDYTRQLVVVGKNSSSGVFAASEYDLIELQSLRIGPLVRERLQVARRPDQTDDRNSILGMDVLYQYALHFRLRQAQIELAATGTYAPMPSANALEFDNKRHPYIPVSVQGEGASAVWDSGAGVTIVDLAWLESHQDAFQPAGTSIGTDSTGKQVETAMYRVHGLAVGEHEFRPHRVAAVDMSYVNAGIERPMDLVIGFSTYSQADWILDFPAGRWKITRMYQTDFFA